MVSIKTTASRITPEKSEEQDFDKGSQQQASCQETGKHFYTQNKVELFHFLADGLQQVQYDTKTIDAAKGEEVVSNDATDVDSLKSKQEEADSRILLHVFHAVQHGHTKILIRIVDTDVIVTAVSLCSQLKTNEVRRFLDIFRCG